MRCAIWLHRSDRHPKFVMTGPRANRVLPMLCSDRCIGTHICTSADGSSFQKLWKPSCLLPGPGTTRPCLGLLCTVCLTASNTFMSHCSQTLPMTHGGYPCISRMTVAVWMHLVGPEHGQAPGAPSVAAICCFPQDAVVLWLKPRRSRFRTA